MGAVAIPPTVELPAINLECRAGGLPLRLLAGAAIRARAALLVNARQPAPPELEPVAPAAPATPVPTAVPLAGPAGPAANALTRTLRGFTLTDLYLEATRAAAVAAAEFEDLEGLACGRTYGDRSIAAADLLIPESYRRAAVEAKRRAEAAGATADFLRGLLGREAAVAALLPEASRA